MNELVQKGSSRVLKKGQFLGAQALHLNWAPECSDVLVGYVMAIFPKLKDIRI